MVRATRLTEGRGSSAQQHEIGVVTGEATTQRALARDLRGHEGGRHAHESSDVSMGGP